MRKASLLAITYWLCCLVLASHITHSLNLSDQFQQTRINKCQTIGCVSCQPGAASSRPVCTACASNSEQRFDLSGGKCVCKPGHGFVRKAAPPINGYHGCIRTRDSAHKGRRLLSLAGSPADDASSSAGDLTVPVTQGQDPTSNSSADGSSSTAADSSSSSSSSSSYDPSSSSTTGLNNASDPRDLLRRLAALRRGAQAEYKATIDRIMAEKQARIAAAESNRTEAASQLQQQHQQAIAAAKATVVAAQAAQKQVQAAAAAATNGSVQAMSVSGVGSRAVGADQGSRANQSVAAAAAAKLEQAVASAQSRLAKKRAERQAKLQQRYRDQLANVTNKMVTRQAAAVAEQQAAATKAAAAAAAAAAQRAKAEALRWNQAVAGSSSSSSVRGVAVAGPVSSSSSTAGGAAEVVPAASNRSAAAAAAVPRRPRAKRSSRGQQQPVALSTSPRLAAIINAIKAAGLRSPFSSSSNNSSSSSSTITPSSSSSIAAPPPLPPPRKQTQTSDTRRSAGKGGSHFIYNKDRNIGYNNGPRPQNPGTGCGCEIWVWVPCAPCPPGTISQGGDYLKTRCVPCPFGTWANDNQTKCVTPPIDGPLFPDFPPIIHNGTPPSPKPPNPDNNGTLIARNVEAFTIAPQPVPVPFDIRGGLKPLVVSVVAGTGPKNGVLSDVDQIAQQVEYTPNERYCSLTGEPDKFKYQVKDKASKIAIANANVTVDCPDTVYTEDAVATTEVGTPVDVPAPIGGGVPPYEVTIIRPPDNGRVDNILVTDVDVTFTYAPNDTYCTQADSGDLGDSFDFEVKETYGSTDVKQVVITVNCPLPPRPSAPELFFNMSPHTNLTIDLGIQGTQPYKFELLGPPLNGNLTGPIENDNITTDGTTSYLPDYYYCSMFGMYDGFYYTVYDKYGQPADGIVTINVLCPDPPFADNQNFETPAQTPVEQRLIVNSTAELIFSVSLYPSFGDVADVTADRVALYTPNSDFCSISDRLDNWGFDVQDIYGQSAFGLVFVKVICPPRPDPVDQLIRVIARVGLVIPLNISIPVGIPDTIETTVDPWNGYMGPFVFDSDDKSKVTTTFTPYAGFCQTEDVPEIMNYAVTDPFGQVGEGGVTFFIKCPDPPTANDQFLRVSKAGLATNLTFQVTGSFPLDWLIYAPPSSGNLSTPALVGSTYVSRYTPHYDYCSILDDPDMMFFMISDAFGAQADGSVAIVVQCPPEPTADDLQPSISVSQTSIDITPSGGPEDSELIFAVSDQPTTATVRYDAARKVFVYTLKAPPCKVGSTDVFVYSVDDVFGQTTAYGTVTVSCVA